MEPKTCNRLYRGKRLQGYRQGASLARAQGLRTVTDGQTAFQALGYLVAQKMTPEAVSESARKLWIVFTEVAAA